MHAYTLHTHRKWAKTKRKFEVRAVHMSSISHTCHPMSKVFHFRVRSLCGSRQIILINQMRISGSWLFARAHSASVSGRMCKLINLSHKLCIHVPPPLPPTHQHIATAKVNRQEMPQMNGWSGRSENQFERNNRYFACAALLCDDVNFECDVTACIQIIQYVREARRWVRVRSIDQGLVEVSRCKIWQRQQKMCANSTTSDAWHRATGEKLKKCT